MSGDVNQSTAGTLEIPAGYTQFYQGKRLDSVQVALTIEVIAIVVQIPGKAQDIRLLDPITSSSEKRTININFETGNGTFAVNIFQTEESLHAFLESRPEQYKLTLERSAIPRILTPGRVFWPPSQRYMDNVNRLIKEKGNDTNLQDIDMFALQGSDILEAAFDDIWEGHPTSSKKARPGDDTEFYKFP